MKSTRIRKLRGGFLSIGLMVGAYNSITKDTRIYMETDRLHEQALLNFMEECCAGSVAVDTFGEDWETESATALASVRGCSGRDGFKLMETGVATGAQSGGGGGSSSNGAGEFFFCYCFLLVAVDCDIF